MINVSATNKALYKRNNILKQYKAVFTDTSISTITHGKIIANSVKIYRQLSTKDALVFGSCNASYITAKLVNVTTKLKGKQFTLYQTINNTDIPYGVYIVDDETNCKDGISKDIKAYDLMTKFDIDISSWYNGLTFPLSKKAFRESLCAYCGVQVESVTLINDSMMIEKTIDAQTGLIGRDVLKCCCEMGACFGVMSNTGTLKHITLSTTVRDTITKGMYRALEYAAYSIKRIDKIQIHESEDDVGGIYGTGTNCYKITGNFLCYGKSTSDLQTYAQNISSVVFNIAEYVPIDLDCIGLPYLECGDFIKVKYGNTELSTYIMNYIISGEQALSGKITSSGDEYHQEENGINVVIKQLKSKTHKLINTVEEMSSQISELDITTGNQATAIETLQSGATALEQSLNGVASDVGDVVADLQAEIERATGAEANMYTMSQTDSQISQSADAIKAEVAGTYTTQADFNTSIQAVDAKFASYSTTSQMNTSLELLENSILADVSESYATKLEMQTVDGKFSSYTLKSEYNTKVQELSSGISVEVQAREEFERKVIGENVCDNNPITADDICNEDGETIVNQILKDNSAKLELLDTKFNVELVNNVNNTSTQLEMLENSIALKQNAGELSSSLSLESGTISLQGNRFELQSTNCSVSLDGTITCNSLVAHSAIIDGTISSAGIKSVGSYGTMELNDGRVKFLKDNYMGYMSSSVMTISKGSNEALVNDTMFRMFDGTNTTQLTATTGTIGGSTILTAGNYSNYITGYAMTNHLHTEYAPTSHSHSSSSLSQTYAGVGILNPIRIGNDTVPTMVLFNSLVSRVAALEQT